MAHRRRCRRRMRSHATQPCFPMRSIRANGGAATLRSSAWSRSSRSATPGAAATIRCRSIEATSPDATAMLGALAGRARAVTSAFEDAGPRPVSKPRGTTGGHMAATGMNHFNILTDDVDATVDFYRDAVGLETGPRPDLGFPGAWMYCGRSPDPARLRRTLEGPAEARRHRPHGVLGDAASPTRSRGSIALASTTRIAARPAPARGRCSSSIRTARASSSTSIRAKPSR